MQLTPDTGTVEAALEELRVVLPVCAMTNIVAERRKQHLPVKDQARILKLWKARQLVAEATVD